jgi:hypothetical protein
VQEAADGVAPVVVEVRALALAAVDLQFVRLVVLVDLGGHAGIDAAGHADQAVLDAGAGGILPGAVLLAVLGGVEVADRAGGCRARRREASSRRAVTFRAVGGEVLGGAAAGPEVALQAAGGGEVAQRAGEAAAVAAGQDTANEGGEAGEEREQGVPGEERGALGDRLHQDKRVASSQVPRLVAALPRQGGMVRRKRNRCLRKGLRRPSIRPCGGGMLPRGRMPPKPSPAPEPPAPRPAPPLASLRNALPVKDL